MNNGNNVKHR